LAQNPFLPLLVGRLLVILVGIVLAFGHLQQHGISSRGSTTAPRRRLGGLLIENSRLMTASDHRVPFLSHPWTLPDIGAAAVQSWTYTHTHASTDTHTRERVRESVAGCVIPVLMGGAKQQGTAACLYECVAKKKCMSLCICPCRPSYLVMLIQ